MASWLKSQNTQLRGTFYFSEEEIPYKWQKVFFPDFVLQHDDGRKVLLEIIGFWTTQYLKSKIEALTAFQEHNILIAILESVEGRKGMEKADTIPQFF